MSTPRKPLHLSVPLLLLVSFLEGGAVMIIELLGAKIIAPYYGVSLYVWSSVLGVTLGALALGYFTGGLLSKKFPGPNTLFMVILAGAFFTALAPLSAPKILVYTESLGVKMGSLVSVLGYLLVPVACFGAVSPIIIQLINADVKDSGRSAGTVYAISTVGGIIATFATGFYLIPTIGIKLTAFITAGALAFMCVTYFMFARKYIAPVAAALLLLSIAVMNSPEHHSKKIKIPYRSTGILGEWTVVERTTNAGQPDESVEKRLLLNGITQTYTQKGFEPLSLWTYPHKIGAYASMKEPGSKALLLGMGGGSIAFELLAMGMELDIVEMDKRVKKIAADHFKFDPSSANVFIDDARHFIRQSGDTYDLVIIDLILGEIQPAHVFSIEGFEDLKKIIKEDALVVINFQGNIDDPQLSLGARSIYKTMEKAGFNVSYYAARSRKNTVTNDIFFIASQTELNLKEKMEDLRYNAWFPYDNFQYSNLVTDAPLALADAYILVDDKPRLELLNASTILQWRKNKSEENIQMMLEEGVRLF